MNKIKIIYDAARKMKDKDSVKGILKAQGLKNENQLFSVNNVFEKSCKDGQTKGKCTMEVDCGGKKMKMENSFDFEGNGCCGHRHFMKHMHSCHQNGMHAGGFKGGLGRITAVLGLLSSIQLSELEDGSAVLTLESANLPEEMKACMQEKMKNGCEHHKHMSMNPQHQEFMKEFHGMENADLVLKVFINKGREIEKITLNASGQKKDDNGLNQEMKLTADLSLEW